MNFIKLLIVTGLLIYGKKRNENWELLHQVSNL